MPAITATTMPVDWVGQTMTWHPTSTQLFYLAAGDTGHEVHRADIGRASSPVVIAKAEPGTTLKDLYVSPDGRFLAWLAAGKEQFSVRVLDLQGIVRGLATFRREEGAPHDLAGWTSEGAVILQRSQQRGSVYEVQLTELPLDGEPRKLAFVADSPVPAVRVDLPRKRLLLTRDEEGVHNIYAVSLRDGGLLKITNNQSLGVSYSGIESLRADAVVFAREERKRDIWVVQRKPVN